VNGKPFRGFESHPLRHFEFEIWSLKSASQTQSGHAAMIKTNMRPITICLALAGTLILAGLTPSSSAQTRRKPAKRPAVCGNPNVTCGGEVTFQPNELPFRIPKNAVIYDTGLFYAVILRSVSSPEDSCDNFIPEPERLAAQTLFTQNKVFTSRCAEPGQVSYTNTSAKNQFMAVYAGMTMADANAMLAKVKATGKFPGANIRRMRAAINGT
jgi:hypothetical protein